MKKYLLTFMSLILIISSGCGQKPEDKVIMTIQGTEVTQGDFNVFYNPYVKIMKEKKSNINAEIYKLNAFHELIDVVIIDRLANAYNIKPTENQISDKISSMTSTLSNADKYKNYTDKEIRNIATYWIKRKAVINAIKNKKLLVESDNIFKETQSETASGNEIAISSEQMDINKNTLAELLYANLLYNLEIKYVNKKFIPIGKKYKKAKEMHLGILKENFQKSLKEI